MKSHLSMRIFCSVWRLIFCVFSVSQSIKWSISQHDCWVTHSKWHCFSRWRFYMSIASRCFVPGYKIGSRKGSFVFSHKLFRKHSKVIPTISRQRGSIQGEQASVSMGQTILLHRRWIIHLLCNNSLWVTMHGVDQIKQITKSNRFSGHRTHLYLLVESWNMKVLHNMFQVKTWYDQRNW